MHHFFLKALFVYKMDSLCLLVIYYIFFDFYTMLNLNEEIVRLFL